VLLDEPPRTQGDLNFTLFGISIRVHPFFWLMALLLGYRAGDAGSVILWVAAVFLAILVHELGHALMMRAYGFQPSIILYGLGGLTSYNQTHFSHSDRSLREVLIVLAGPAAGFLLAALLVVVTLFLGHGEKLLFVGPGNLLPQIVLPDSRFAELLNNLFFVCVFWGLINLLPVYPLDGGQVMRAIFLKLDPHNGLVRSLTLSMFTATAMALYAFLKWNSIFVTLLFGYLAYASFMAARFFSNRW